MTAARLTIRRRGELIEILAGNVVLLSSAALETERAFGRLAATVEGRAPSNVLVGGLGFGATVRGVLEVAPRRRPRRGGREGGGGRGDRARRARVALPERPLDDPRVARRACRRPRRHAREPGAFDAILLDVDNGPQWASFRTNARLYTPAGLAVARAALAPGRHPRGVERLSRRRIPRAPPRGGLRAPAGAAPRARPRPRARLRRRRPGLTAFGYTGPTHEAQRDPRRLRRAGLPATRARPTGWCSGCSTRSST